MHIIKMFVLGKKFKPMLQSSGGNPYVIGRDRSAGLSETVQDKRVEISSFNIYGMEDYSWRIKKDFKLFSVLPFLAADFES